MFCVLYTVLLQQSKLWERERDEKNYTEEKIYLQYCSVFTETIHV